jgi:uncharacterized paraquat-inducible protein A
MYYHCKCTEIRFTLPQRAGIFLIGDTMDKEFAQSITESKYALDENFHVCLVCNGSGKKHDNNPCPMCSHQWKSVRITSPEQCMVDGGNMDNISNFFGFDKGWDL